MGKSKSQEQATICKIVCFDEGSATDYIQIVNGGKISTVKEKNNEKEASASGKAEAKVGLKTKLIEILTGIDASAEISGSGGISFSTSAVAKSIISNTVLTDFLKEAESHQNDIRIFENFTVQTIDNSLASYTLLTPYLTILQGNNTSSGDFNLALEKLDSTIKDAKGYYEFLGVSDNEEEEVVFRFNRESFKNNYKVTDLLRMNLVIYATKVGTCSLEDLDISNELNMPHVTAPTNPSYEPIKASTDNNKLQRNLNVYDVLLAGVKTHG